MYITEIKSAHHASLSFFLGYLMRGIGSRSCERWARRKRLPLWNCDSSQRMVSRALPISLFSSSSAETTEYSITYKHIVPVIVVCDMQKIQIFKSEISLYKTPKSENNQSGISVVRTNANIGMTNTATHFSLHISLHEMS